MDDDYGGASSARPPRPGLGRRRLRAGRRAPVAASRDAHRHADAVPGARDRPAGDAGLVLAAGREDPIVGAGRPAVPRATGAPRAPGAPAAAAGADSRRG